MLLFFCATPIPVVATLAANKAAATLFLTNLLITIALL
jgi:hypothetical protein